MNAILIGRYSVHAMVAIALALLAGFLYVFNFTTFF